MREQFGGPGVSDEEFLLRYIMKGEKEIAAMRAAGPPKQYFDSRMSLLDLVEELGKHKGIATSASSAAATLLVQNRL